MNKELQELKKAAEDAMDAGRQLAQGAGEYEDMLVKRIDILVRHAFALGMDYQKKESEG